MEQFKIRQNGFSEIKKGILARTIPLLLLAASGGLVIAYFGAKGRESEETATVFIIMIPLILIIMGISLYRGIKRQKTIFESYKLTIDNDGITREQCHIPPISIPLAEISKIYKTPKGGLIVVGNSAANAIGIPSQIENLEKLEQLLSGIKDISDNGKAPFFQKHARVFSILLPLVTMGLVLIVYLGNNKIIVGVCGAILIIFLAYAFIKIQKDKNIDTRIKKGAWLMTFVFISIIVAIVHKVF